jgi:phosphatidylethanolamine/phosphatidyl-N-methylethanolamine N-methyltransferase
LFRHGENPSINVQNGIGVDYIMNITYWSEEGMRMNNRWNSFIYTCWAPVYDFFFNRGLFYAARKRVFENVNVAEGSKVLFVGVGTGADLAFFPLDRMKVVAVDYSIEMLKKAKRKYPNIEFIQMDAQSLSFPAHSFDMIVASLVVSVVPNPEKAISEMVRVTKKGGSVIIFDKFVPKHKELSIMKKIIRPFIRLLGTDIGISFEKIYEIVKHECHIVEDTEVMVQGMYRKIVLEKYNR